MPARSDVTVDWSQSPRIITVLSPSTSITVQDLLDTCREAEDDPQNMCFPILAQASGKDDLGGGELTGITLKLLNALLAFESRPGPDFVKCSVDGGNLLAADSNGTFVDPIANTNYTQVKVTISVSAALLPGNVAADQIAAAVWNSLMSQYNTTGSFGKELPTKTDIIAGHIVFGKG